MESTYKFKLIKRESDSSYFKEEADYNIFFHNEKIGVASSKVLYERIMSFDIEFQNKEHIDKVKEELILFLIHDLDKNFKITAIEVKSSQIQKLNSSISELLLIFSKIGFSNHTKTSLNEIIFHLKRNEEIQVGQCWPKYVKDNGEWSLFTVSKEYFGDKYNFNPVKCGVQIPSGSLITFKLSEIGIPQEFAPFNSGKYGNLLDFEKIRNKNRINLYANLDSLDFLLDNDLYEVSPDLELYTKICNNLKYLRNNIESDKKIASSIFENYEIILNMNGRTKHGDYKTAWINIMTSRGISYFYFDEYLKNLTPTFEYDFGLDRDQDYSENYTDIHERISYNYGGLEKMNEIKIVVSNLSSLIKKYAILT